MALLLCEPDDVKLVISMCVTVCVFFIVCMFA